MACLDDNTLFELAQGRADPATVSAAEAHLDGCAKCRKALATALKDSPELGRPPARVEAGTPIGRYLVLERVGAGAVGQVFAAWDPQLDRKVALKLLRPGGSAAEQRARLQREAQTLARLSHPNVVTIFDVGLWEEQLFIALEFVAGGSARQWVSREPRTWQQTVGLYIQAAHGLAAAHAAGVVHRDFKPDNVMVRTDGRAQVTDFGLAAETPSGAPATGVALTATGALLGTPAYMAPDQLEGKEADARSDQFSFCVALFEALDGERPFAGSTFAELAAAARKGPLRASSKVPPAVHRILARGASPKDADRFASLDALAAALEGTLRGRTGAYASFAAAAGVVGLVAFVATRAPAPALTPGCQRAHDRHAAVVGPAKRAELEKVFAASTSAWAAPTAKLVTAALTQRHDAWLQQSDEACEAMVAAPGELWKARLACLEDRWTELGATVDVLTSGGPEVVDRASRIAERLPPAGLCLQLQLPVALSAEDRVVAARAAALIDLGRNAAAEELTRGKPAPAIRFQRGRALQELGKADDAQAEYLEAGLGAVRLGDEPLTAAAWAQLGNVIGYLRSQPAEGDVWARQAEAVAARGNDRQLDERLALVRGNIETRRGKLPEAEAHFRRAEALTRERLGEKSPARARMVLNLANTVFSLGRTDEALALMEEAKSVLSATLGPTHPDVLQVLASRAVALVKVGKLELATKEFEAVLAGYRASLPANHPKIGSAALNLAEAYALGKRPKEAVASYREAVEVWTATFGADSPHNAAAWGGIGAVQLGAGEAADAAASYERAARICEKGGCEPVDEGQVRFGWARALLGTGAKWAACEAEAKKAIALFAPEATKGERAEVQSWLDKKGK